LPSNPWSFSELGQGEARAAMALPGKESNKKRFFFPKNLALVISHNEEGKLINFLFKRNKK